MLLEKYVHLLQKTFLPFTTGLGRPVEAFFFYVLYLLYHYGWVYKRVNLLIRITHVKWLMTCQAFFK